MIKPKLLIPALAAVLFFTKANAQEDTTHYDLGHFQLKKEFTQCVTVKGEDLEKMPFINLAEAINVWFYGSYTNSATVVYVIDGNQANDVNAYSVYDIDEVTLIQNATAQLSGAVGPQQLVLIKTKRAKQKGLAITAAGQADLSSAYTNDIPGSTANTYQTGLKSTTTLYQQYYLSATENMGNVQFGVSANYLRDELPEIHQGTVNYENAINLDRLRFNGFFNAKFGNSILDITGGYVPQRWGELYSSTDTNNVIAANHQEHIHLWNGALRLTTHILPGLTNVLKGDYNYYSFDDMQAQVSSFTNDNTYTTTANYQNHAHNIVAYDNLTYDAKLGNWGLEPAVNLTFRTYRDSTSELGSSSSNTGVFSTYENSYWAGVHIFLLTPSVNLYYRNYFNVQAGFIYNISTHGEFYTNNNKPQKLLPFVTGTIDIAHLIDSTSSLIVKAYGSYVQSNYLGDGYNALPDISSSYVPVPLVGPGDNQLNMGYQDYSYNHYPGFVYQQGLFRTFNTASAGLTISPAKSGLTLGYFFEQTGYVSPIYEYVPYNDNSTELLTNYVSTGMVLNRVSLNYTLANSSAFNWQTGINATMIKQTYAFSTTESTTRGNNTWTGGWVNRLKYRDLFAGVDVLYEVGEKVYTQQSNGSVTSETINSFSLQNLYAGYNLKVKGLQGLEVFANARNLFQNKKEDITDNGKYYGLGFRLSL